MIRPDWNGRMVDQLAAAMPNLEIQLLQPVVAKGHTKGDDFKALDVLASMIKAKHKELGIL